MIDKDVKIYLKKQIKWMRAEAEMIRKKQCLYSKTYMYMDLSLANKLEELIKKKGK